MSDHPATGGDALGELLVEICPRITHLQRHVLGELTPPLTLQQHRLLARLRPGRISLVQLREQSTVTFSTLSETLKNLVGQGLVSRTVNPLDRRTVDLALTAKGRRLLRRADEALATFADELVATIPAADRAAVARALAPLTEEVAERLRQSHRHTAVRAVKT